MNNKKIENRDPETGRFLSTYDPKYDQMLIDHLSEGLSFESFAGVIGVNRDTVFVWANNKPSFKEAKEIGTAKSMLYWEKMGIAGTVGKLKNFVPAAWIFNMKNRFKWSNKEEIKHIGSEDEFSVTHDKIMEYIERKKL